MPVANYGLLRGRVINSLPYKKGADHYNIEVSAAGELYRIAVDVYSAKAGTKVIYSASGGNTLQTDREVMFYKDENFNHPLLKTLAEASEGMTTAADLPGILKLDYIRTTPALFPIDEMTVVPPKEDGDANGLNEDIDPWVKKATNNDNAAIFAFGSGWDDSNSTHPDTHPYFNPNPSLGVHDIHMNQGDITKGPEGKYNGINQDGGLFFYFADTDTWVAMFFRFQNQSTSTDDDGNPA